MSCSPDRSVADRIGASRGVGLDRPHRIGVVQLRVLEAFDPLHLVHRRERSDAVGQARAWQADAQRREGAKFLHQRLQVAGQRGHRGQQRLRRLATKQQQLQRDGFLGTGVDAVGDLVVGLPVADEAHARIVLQRGAHGAVHFRQVGVVRHVADDARTLRCQPGRIGAGAFGELHDGVAAGAGQVQRRHRMPQRLARRIEDAGSQHQQLRVARLRILFGQWRCSARARHHIERRRDRRGQHAAGKRGGQRAQLKSVHRKIPGSVGKRTRIVDAL